MPAAVGVIQTLGFPGILAAADAMVKSGRVTLVYFGLAERSQFLVAVRGSTSEVRPAVDAGIEAVGQVYGAELIDYWIIPNPPENLEVALDINYTAEVERFM